MNTACNLYLLSFAAYILLSLSYSFTSSKITFFRFKTGSFFGSFLTFGSSLIFYLVFASILKVFSILTSFPASFDSMKVFADNYIMIFFNISFSKSLFEKKKVICVRNCLLLILLSLLLFPALHSKHYTWFPDIGELWSTDLFSPSSLPHVLIIHMLLTFAELLNHPQIFYCIA